jgi:hypothetical protein
VQRFFLTKNISCCSFCHLGQITLGPFEHYSLVQYSTQEREMPLSPPCGLVALWSCML